MVLVVVRVRVRASPALQGVETVVVVVRVRVRASPALQGVEMPRR